MIFIYLELSKSMHLNRKYIIHIFRKNVFREILLYLSIYNHYL